MSAGSIDDYVARIVAEAPPLSPAQKQKLAALFAAQKGENE